LTHLCAQFLLCPETFRLLSERKTNSNFSPHSRSNHSISVYLTPLVHWFHPNPPHLHAPFPFRCMRALPVHAGNFYTLHMYDPFGDITGFLIRSIPINYPGTTTHSRMCAYREREEGHAQRQTNILTHSHSHPHSHNLTLMTLALALALTLARYYTRNTHIHPHISRLHPRLLLLLQSPFIFHLLHAHHLIFSNYVFVPTRLLARSSRQAKYSRKL
jgi:hypothetical protein